MRGLFCSNHTSPTEPDLSSASHPSSAQASAPSISTLSRGDGSPTGDHAINANHLDVDARCSFGREAAPPGLIRRTRIEWKVAGRRPAAAEITSTRASKPLAAMFRFRSATLRAEMARRPHSGFRGADRPTAVRSSQDWRRFPPSCRRHARARRRGEEVRLVHASERDGIGDDVTPQQIHADLRSMSKRGRFV